MLETILCECACMRAVRARWRAACVESVFAQHLIKIIVVRATHSFVVRHLRVAGTSVFRYDCSTFHSMCGARIYVWCLL